ncbi:hypothetical protein FLL45_00345 [Aliikangiella marina]|uniref:Uncharacterized protein n=1 Tax=Aliikangiella marina TaxID=1712262 RepID=A0A545TH36_9GAMM|nr:hypothetical protein [Aliikangiella marina]TQV76451.1 hypothetical protein FLL45_00345 [Aliikangiella marina]
MKNYTIKALILLTTLLVAMPALGVNRYCSGKIQQVWVDSSGGVLIRSTWRNDHTQICDIDSEWKGVTAEVCKTWFSLIQTISVSGEDAKVYYADAPTCDALPTYRNAPAPGYVMLNLY